MESHVWQGVRRPQDEVLWQAGLGPAVLLLRRRRVRDVEHGRLLDVLLPERDDGPEQLLGFVILL